MARKSAQGRQTKAYKSFVATLALLSISACGKVVDGSGDGLTGVPLAARPTASVGASPTGVGGLPSADEPTLPGTTTVSSYEGPYGASLRAVANPNLCVSAPVGGSGASNVILTACTNTLNQQFSLSFYTVKTAVGGCLAVPADANGVVGDQAPIVTASCSQTKGSGYVASLYPTRATALGFSLASLLGGGTDAALTCLPSVKEGCQLALSHNQLAVQVFAAEPPGTPGVRIPSIFGSTCLARLGSNITFSSCTKAAAGQLWKLANHQIESDAGTCVLATDPSAPVTLGSCAQAAALGSWSFDNLLFVFYGKSSQNGSTTMILPGSELDQPIVLQAGYQKLSDYVGFGPPTSPQ